jgi:hypothetical protein
MAERVVLHVGAMKSGTSALQSLLFNNAVELRDQGVLVPGDGFRDQVRAVQDVLGTEAVTYVEEVAGSWDALLQRIQAWSGTAVVSMELLAGCRPRKAAHVVERLDGTPVEIVLTVRDLNRNIPAMWQETLQNGKHWTWPQYLRGVRRARPDAAADERDQVRPGLSAKAGRSFWRQQDVGRIVRTWSDVVGVDRLTVVTVPHPGASRSLLVQRFADAVGFDLTGLREAPSRNPSLGASSAQLLRRLNATLTEEGMAFPYGRLLRKHMLAKQLLASHRAEEPAIGLAVEDWVRDTSASVVRNVKERGVRLVGDWADLEPVEVPGIDPTTVTAEDEGEASFVGLVGVLKALMREHEGRPVPDDPLVAPGA